MRQVNATDNVLMAQVSRGEVTKMAVLFERHHRLLYRYFVSMNRSRDLSEDLVQEVFLRMLRYRATYDSSQPFTAWMYKIARNASVDQIRKRRAEVVGIDEAGDKRPEQASEDPGPEERAARGEDLALLQRALEQLPDDKREVLVLSRFQEMKYEDIAAVLGCETASVKVRVFRAMRALEQIYSELRNEKTA